MNHMSFHALCDALHKSVPYVKNLQRALALPILRGEIGYSPAYESFLRTIIVLKTLCIPEEKIIELLELEKKILKLLHMDTLSDSPTWFLDSCSDTCSFTQAKTRLLLTGYDVGFPLENGAVQHRLNFGERDPELFKHHEMGEDICQILERYRSRVEQLKERIRTEIKVIETAQS